MPDKPKVIVEEVEGKVDLSEATIDALTEVGKELTGTRPGRAGETTAEKAASDQVTVSTIETVTTPHSQEEDSLTSLGQRIVNLVWEHTQRNLAYYVVGVAVTVAAYLSVFGDEAIRNTAFTFLCTMAGSVIGFYFGRTNHQKIGGVTQGR